MISKMEINAEERKFVSGEAMKPGSSEATRSFTCELTIFRVSAFLNCGHFITYEFRDKQFK